MPRTVERSHARPQPRRHDGPSRRVDVSSQDAANRIRSYTKRQGRLVKEESRIGWAASTAPAVLPRVYLNFFGLWRIPTSGRAPEDARPAGVLPTNDTRYPHVIRGCALAPWRANILAPLNPNDLAQRRKENHPLPDNEPNHRQLAFLLVDSLFLAPLHLGLRSVPLRRARRISRKGAKAQNKNNPFQPPSRRSTTVGIPALRSSLLGAFAPWREIIPARTQTISCSGVQEEQPAKTSGQRMRQAEPRGNRPRAELLKRLPHPASFRCLHRSLARHIISGSNCAIRSRPPSTEPE
jgi:hypothetical protein